jgi:hypothetical protein
MGEGSEEAVPEVVENVSDAVVEEVIVEEVDQPVEE